MSTNRRSDCDELSRLLRGELDWIVMKCLEKDRNRRYATANGLAADVERYLQRRAGAGVSAVGMVSVAKVGATESRAVYRCVGGCAADARKHRYARDQQHSRATRTGANRSQKERAEEAEKLAVQRAEEINQGLERLKAANELVDTARFYIDERRWDTASEAFTMAIELRPEHAPAWEGRGMLYASLGLWDLAASDLAQAAALQEPATAYRWLIFALTRAYVGDIAGYRAACADARAPARHDRLPLHDRHGARWQLLADSPVDARALVQAAEPIVAMKPKILGIRMRSAPPTIVPGNMSKRFSGSVNPWTWIQIGAHAPSTIRSWRWRIIGWVVTTRPATHYPMQSPPSTSAFRPDMRPADASTGSLAKAQPTSGRSSGGIGWRVSSRAAKRDRDGTLAAARGPPPPCASGPCLCRPALAGQGD